MDLLTRPSRLGALLLWMALVGALTCAALALMGVLSGGQAMIGCGPLFVVIAVGVADQRSGVFARPILSVRTTRRELALTFDDGPDPRWTPALLDLLDGRGHRATFFVIGAKAEQHPALLQEIVKRGHELANHTWSHSFLTVFFSPERLAAELERTNRAVHAATGGACRWFRPPVGLLSPRVAPGVQGADLEIVGWTQTARDGVARTTVATALERLVPAVAAGAILVMHDAPIGDDRPLIVHELLSQLLDAIESAGLRSVTLSELIDGPRL